MYYIICIMYFFYNINYVYISFKLINTCLLTPINLIIVVYRMLVRLRFNLISA